LNLDRRVRRSSAGSAKRAAAADAAKAAGRDVPAPFSPETPQDFWPCAKAADYSGLTSPPKNDRLRFGVVRVLLGRTSPSRPGLGLPQAPADEQPRPICFKEVLGMGSEPSDGSGAL